MEKRRHTPTTLLQLIPIFVMLQWLPSGRGFGGCPYGQRCSYIPAPPGQAPRCAQPGLTYCVDVDKYPRDLIRRLVALGSYDINTFLTDETTEEFSTLWKPKQTGPYGYGPNSLPGVEHISLTVDEPYNQDIYSQYLQPPTYRPSNFSQIKRPSSITNPNLYDYYNINGGEQNFFNNHVFNPGFNLPSNGWTQYSVSKAAAEKTKYKPLEWWRYTDPRNNARSDTVTIEKSISFPPVSTTYYPGSKSPFQQRPKRSISGKKALELAFRQSRIENEQFSFSRLKRQGAGAGGPDGSALCKVRVEYVTPKAALNNQGEWKYVVNMDENMTQLVRAEICISEKCSNLCSLPTGYASKCRQKYIQKRLVALGSDGQSLYTDTFWIPSCCECTISDDNVT